MNEKKFELKDLKEMIEECRRSVNRNIKFCIIGKVYVESDKIQFKLNL